jgi:hypothetical protein
MIYPHGGAGARVLILILSLALLPACKPKLIGNVAGRALSPSITPPLSPPDSGVTPPQDWHPRLHEANSEGGRPAQANTSTHSLSRVTIGGSFKKSQAASPSFKVAGGIYVGF